MSATDELRRLLDERGVEWRKPAQEYWVLLGMPEGDSATIVGELSIEEATDGTLVAYNLTPEQAIAATLGAGTCRFKTVIDKDPSRRHRENICECDGCGYRCARGFIEDERFKYCPNCGARVVEVDE